MKTTDSKIQLSIIILTYNTKDLVLQAVKSIEENYPNEVSSGDYQIIVADNKSTDGTLDLFRDYKEKTKIKHLQLVDNNSNLGFSRGNNNAISYAKGKYVLFLNPDTIVYKKTLTYLLDFMNSNPNAGAVSCKLINKENKIDFNCHRGFPTPWNAFCYFSGIQRIFPKSKIFAGYTQGWKNLNTTHEVDAIEGAFMLMPYAVGQKLGWWDEDYFFYGEDLQFCFDIKKLGYKIYYIGEVSIMHIGGASSGIKKDTENLTSASVDAKKKIQVARFDAMKIFYKKNYETKYPFYVFMLIDFGINLLRAKALARLSAKNKS